MNEDDTQPKGPEGPQAPLGDEAPTQPLGDEAPTQPLGEGTAQRRLVRTRSDRVLGGVCSGIARYFNIDPILVRIGAVGLTLLGGAGVLLYVAALLLMPSEAGEGAPSTAGAGRNSALVAVGVVLLLLVSGPFLLGGGILLAGLIVPLAFLVAAGVVVWWLVAGEGPGGEPRDIARRAALGVGVLVLCAVVFLLGAWGAAVGGGAVVAGIVIAAGIAILAGAFMRPVRWLILPALSLALAAGIVSAAGIDLTGGVGERDYRPGSAADVQDHYEIGMGELRIDLRDADLPPGDTVVRLDVGLGEANVLVADDVCVATRADVGVGEVDVFDRDNGGVDFDWKDDRQAKAGVSRLVLDADIGMGALKVGDTEFRGFGRSEWDFGPHGRDGDGRDVQDNGNAACESGRASG
ncbi:MAG TPA: PspC domain-containing protein [Thermoleophilaceae bacterium]|nr:PspC domain-containing protein [Thermoleophilaceae bacterium]